jgi:hypothetical protein
MAEIDPAHTAVFQGINLTAINESEAFGVEEGPYKQSVVLECGERRRKQIDRQCSGASPRMDKRALSPYLQKSRRNRATGTIIIGTFLDLDLD